MTQSTASRARQGSVAAPSDDVVAFAALRATDTARAGGKGANLGELAAAGFPVPPGFVITGAAFAHLRDSTDLGAELEAAFADLDSESLEALDAACTLAQAAVRTATITGGLRDDILRHYAELIDDASTEPVIVRSSATLEDTTAASFAGMNETYGNVLGADAVLEAIRECWASLFAPRTVYYRARHDFPLAGADIAVVVQRYVPAARAGIMFSIDPLTGERDRIVVEGAFGGGEAVVSGQVTPDRYLVEKATLRVMGVEVHDKTLRSLDVPGGGTELREIPSNERVLNDDQLHAVAELGRTVEQHYGTPQDMEWVFDPADHLWLVQSRPVTTGSPSPSTEPSPTTPTSADSGAVLVRGLAAAHGIASGPVRVLTSLDQGSRLQEGDILVTRMTAPDWVPLMKRASAIVTDTGGMTCHAAIVARELEIPCIVGASTATTDLVDGAIVTVDADRGIVREGAHVVAPAAPAATVASAGVLAHAASPITATNLLVNLSEPSQAQRVAALDSDGVGLLRAELMVVEALEGVHPLKLIADGRGDEVVERLAASLTIFAEAFGNRPITYRTIDFRTNEFRGLEGGDQFEPVEANPMIGFRGAARYVAQPALLELELRAIARVWEQGHRTLHVMLPFVRTPHEVRVCRQQLEACGLLDQRGFELWVMAEVPSVLMHMEAYAALGVSGISIGSNDLTQLVLGVDRDSDLLPGYEETDPAVMRYVQLLLREARRLDLRTSICGEAPARHPAYVQLLVDEGIDSISVTPTALTATRRSIARVEQRLLLDRIRTFDH